MFAQVYSSALIGLEAKPISIEIDISRGVPQIIIVGLPDTAVSEARERVKSAIRASGFEVPMARIVVNMAPADLRKEGAYFDLAIAVGILCSSQQVSVFPCENTWLIGELSLNGEIRSVNGTLAIVSSAKEQGIRSIIVPKANIAEATLIDGIDVYGANTLQEVIEILGSQGEDKEKYIYKSKEYTLDYQDNYIHDLKYVKGQYQAKRALEISAAGGHNLLFVGEPGCGKSMLAQCMPSILPPLSKQMALEVTKIYSVAGLLNKNKTPLMTQRPFRSPHHSVSGAGLIGGGTSPTPGEITLAHHGVLFLDELSEFDKKTLDQLRQPIETGDVTISRVRFTVNYPSKFLLLSACNPPEKSSRRKSIISAPLWDRFGLVVWVPPLKSSELNDFDSEKQLSSRDVRVKVARAWDIQQGRFDRTGKLNAHMTAKEINLHCNLTADAKQLMNYAAAELNLTGRTYDHILKVARTIADLDLYDEIEDEHIAEAIQYRTSQESILAKTTV